MNDLRKTKAQLAAELVQLRRRVAELEQADVARQRAEQALHQSETSLRALLDAVNDSMMLIEPDGTIVAINQTTATRLNTSLAALLGHNAYDFVPTEVAEHRLAYAAQVITTGQPVRFEDERFGRWIDSSICPVMDDHGQVVRLAIFGRDITAQKQAESQREAALKSLQKSEATLSAVFESSQQSFMLLAPDRRVQLLNRVANERARAIYGRGIQAGDSIYAFMPPASRAGFDERFERVLAGESIRFEQSFMAGEQTHWYEYHVTPVRATDGQIIGVFVLTTDITDRKQAEAALRESEERFRTLLQSIPTVSVQGYQLDGTTHYWNDASERLYGYSAREAIGRNLLDLIIPPEMRDGVKQAIQQMAETQQPIPSAELSLMRKDGSRVAVFSSHAITQPQGRAPELFCLDIDLTERKQVEAALRTSRDYLQAVLDATNDALFVDEADTGQIIDVNQRMCEMYGYTREEALRTPIGDLSQGEPPYSQAEAVAWLTKARESGPQTFEWRAKRKDGQLFWAEVSIRFAMFGNDARYVVTVRDIAERKHAETALLESEERFRLAFDTSPDAVNINRLTDGLYVDVNQGFTALTGYTRQDTVGRTSADINIWHNPADRQKLVQSLQATGYCENLEAQFNRKDGVVTTALMSARVVTLRGVPHILSITRDISERKRAENALRESEELLSLFIQHSPIYAYIKEVTPTRSRVLRASENFQDMIGVSGTDMAGKTMDELFSAEFAAKMTADDWAVVSSGAALKLDEDLNGRSYTTIKFPIVLGNKRLLAGYTIDITDRQQAEEAERETRQLAEALRDTATILNASLDLDAVLDRVLVNIERVVPHDGATIMLVDGDEARIVRARGWCSVANSQPEQHTVSKTPNLRTMRLTGEPCIIGHVHDCPDWQVWPGGEWIASYAGAPICAAGDQLLGYLGLYSARPGHFSDQHIQRLKIFAAQAALAIQNAQLHSRIQAYSEELEERVRQRTRQLSEANARLSELDRLKDDFISRISHELRTPLTSIKIYLELLESGKPEKRLKYMQVLHEQSDRLQQLIENLLNVTQQVTSATDVRVLPVDLNHLAMSLAADVTPRAARRSLTFNITLATGLPPVAADAILLTQALSNIVANALSYTPAGGTIDLTTAQVIDQGDIWITATIQDTGPGIGPDELPHIFDRFYRGRAAADYKTPGAGVGLFISHDILTALDGRLTVDSHPGAGATFTAWLRPAPPALNQG